MAQQVRFLGKKKEKHRSGDINYLHYTVYMFYLGKCAWCIFFLKALQIKALNMYRFFFLISFTNNVLADKYSKVNCLYV